MATAPFPIRKLGPLKVSVATQEAAIAHILSHLKSGKKLAVAFANTNLVTQTHRNPAQAKALSSFLVLNDGIGLDIASKLFHGSRFPANLNGTDFTPALLAKLPKGCKVFLYGAQPGVAQKAAKAFTKAHGVKVVGAVDGYQKASGAELCKTINASGATVVLVALGNPRQEEWIAQNHATLKAPICVAVGALFDFVSHTVPRAPQWVQKLHLEWLYRLMHEPRRLARRYTIDILHFLYICHRHSKAKR